MSRSLDGGGPVMALPKPTVSKFVEDHYGAYVVWQSEAAPGYYGNPNNYAAVAGDLWEVSTTGAPYVYRYSNVIACVPINNGDAVTINARNYPKAPLDAAIHYIMDYGYTIPAPGSAVIRAGVSGGGSLNCVLISTIATGVETLSFQFYATATVTVTRANWNIDRLDGTGPSRINIMSRTQSSDGTARAWKLIVTQSRGILGSTRIGFVVDDSIIYAHEFSVFRGSLSPSDFLVTAARAVYGPYFSITQTSANINAPKAHLVHASVIADGPSKAVAPSHVRCYSTGTATVNSGTSGTFVPLVSIRTASGVNDPNKLIAPMRLAIGNTGASAVAFRMVLNGTLTGASFTDTEQAVSAAAVDTSATVLANGRVLTAGHVAAGTVQIYDFTNDCYQRPIGTTVMLAVNETYSLTAATASGSACALSFTLTWAEFH